MTAVRTPSDLIADASAVAAALRKIATPGSALEASAQVVEDLIALCHALAQPARAAERIEAEAWRIAERRVDALLDRALRE